MISIEKKIFVKKVIDGNNCEIEEAFFKERCTQIIMPEMGNLRIQKGGFVVLDFGEEICGVVHLLLGLNAQEGKFRLRLGESVAETCAELNESFAGNNHSVRDICYPIISHAVISSCESGFRFARIDVLEGENLCLKTVYVEAQEFNGEKKGCFHCNDEMVNDIYKVAERTVSLCIQNNVVWDGIKRDRCVWLGDFHPEMLAILQVYGDIPALKNVLNQADIFIKEGAWINEIPAYSAWWLVCLNEYYQATGNAEYVKEKLCHVHTILSDFEKIVSINGDIDFSKTKLKMQEENAFYFDWPTFFTEDGKAGWESFIIYACQKTEKLLNDFEEDCLKAKEVIKRLKNKGVECSEYKQVEAFHFLAGRRLAQESITRLIKGDAKGMTGFMGYYILSAAALSGANKEILSMIKGFYGGMIQCGATTFWEDFDVRWLEDNPQSLTEMPIKERQNIHRDYGKFCYKGLRHSLCHGWTSGIIAFLSRKVLGVEPVESGYKAIEISPNLIGLEWVEGVVPTPKGEIFIEHKVLSNGEIKTFVRLPKGIVINCKYDINVERY